MANPYCDEPLVVEDLGEVAASGVGEDHHDDGVLALGRAGQLLGELPGRVGRHPAGATDQQRLLARQPAREGEGVGVADLDDPVGDGAVVGLGPEVLADALDEVGAAGAAGVDRARGVGADHLHGRVLLLEVPPDAADGAAGAHAGDEVGDPALGLLPDLGTGLLVVGPRVVRVGVLVGLPGAGLAGEPVGDVVVGVGVLGRHRRRADDDLGAVGLQHVALVLADLVGADEDALVPLGLRHHREPDPGVARRRFDDRAARLELARGLGGLDHPGRDAVLHRAAGVEVLDLGEHERARRQLGTVTAVRQVEGAGQADEGVFPMRSRTEFAYFTPANYVVTSEFVELAPWRRSARKLARGVASAGGGLAVAEWRGLTACSTLEAKLARKTIGGPLDDPVPNATGLVRPRPARARPHRGAARRLQRRRLRRRPGRGDPGSAARQRRGRAGRPPGLPRHLLRRRRAVRRPPHPGRPGAADRARCRHDPDRRQRRHPRDIARGVGAAPLRGRQADCGRRAWRSSSAPAPTSARSSRSPRRSSRWRARGRGGWPPPRPSRC